MANVPSASIFVLFLLLYFRRYSASVELTGFVYVSIVISESCRLLGTSCCISLWISKYNRAFLSDEILYMELRGTTLVPGRRYGKHRSVGAGNFK